MRVTNPCTTWTSLRVIIDVSNIIRSKWRSNRFSWNPRWRRQGKHCKNEGVISVAKVWRSLQKEVNITPLSTPWGDDHTVFVVTFTHSPQISHFCFYSEAIAGSRSLRWWRTTTKTSKYVNTRELLGYVANDSTIFHHADRVSVLTVAVFSLRSKMLSQYWMPNALVDVMSSNDILHNILFHRDRDASTIFNTKR